MTRRVLAGIIVLGLALSSCATRSEVGRPTHAAVAAPTAAGTQAVPAPAETPDVAPAAAGGTDSEVAVGDGAQPPAAVAVDEPAATSSTPATTDTTATADTLAVTATVHPACVSPGGTVEVRIATAGGATLGLAALYADNEPHGAMGFGEAGIDGRYVWGITVPADVAAGDASALVGAELVGEDGSRRSGRAIAPFRVTGAGGCG